MPNFPIIPEDEMRRKLEPPSGRIRLMIDTDAHNEIDDQYAIAWALLSQDVFDVEGVLAEPYSQAHHRDSLIAAYDALKQNANADLSDILLRYQRTAERMIANDINPHEIVFVPPDEGMELSYQEILKVYDLLEEDSAGKVFRGSPSYLQSYDAPIKSDAADFIIERAMADDDRPLYIACIGCLTNLASAILMKPEIIEKIVVLWTSSYPSWVSLNNRPSLNLVQDIPSSQLLFDCGVPHVYLPGYYIGEQLKLSLPDMEAWVRGKSKIGDYLYHLYTHNPIHPIQGINDHYARTWVIWDLINFAWLLNPEWVPSHIVRSPILTDDLYYVQHPKRHLMREAVGIDRDAIFRDLFAKLEKAP
ncbi:MAG: nucleoside hydrolase [Anaerolineae bacterium]|nr:nucleoside hydrolase [Anaerolineae bacterium]